MSGRVLRGAAPVALLLTATSLAAQHPNHDPGFRPARALDGSGIETVNIQNGNLSLAIPIGGSYPLGPELSYGLTLTWAANPWEWEEKTDPTTGDPYLQAQPRSRSNAGFGWELSLGRFLRSFDPENPSPHHAYMAPNQALHDLEGGALHLGQESFPGILFSKDGTYLRRIHAEAKVEFPDGTVRTFESGRLKRMEDRFNNALDIDYTVNLLGEPLVWDLSDTHGRTHQIRFAKLAKRLVLSEVRLEAFGGATAIYGFTYEEGKLPRACNAPANRGDTSDVRVPLLTRVTRPDGSAYEMPAERYRRSTAACTTEAGRGDRRLTGSLERLELPTGGVFEYTWQAWEFPEASASLPDGEGEPTGGSENPFRFGAGLAERRWIPRGSTVPLGRWEYDPEITPPAAGTPKRELLVTVTARPNGETTKHYFSVYAGFGNDNPPPGWTRHEYGLPFTRDTTDGSSPGRFLSQEIFDKAGTKLRSVYVRYENSGFGENPRLASQRTVYHDDGGRRADVNLQDFDGLGQFRSVTTAGNLPGQNARTTKTNWNPGHSVSDIPDPAEPWVLDVFDRTEVTEGGQTVTREFDFTDKGFLRRTRARRNATCGPDDVVVHRVEDPNRPGFLRREDIYGGDDQDLACGDLKTLTLPATPLYRRRYTHQCGVLAMIEWLRPADFSALTFLPLDRTIDCPSGLVASSRDTAGLQTTFGYDLLGRITDEKLPAGEGADTTYQYSRETANLPARVTIQRKNGSSVLTEEKVFLDGFGRVAEEHRTLPGGATAVRRTLWSSRGWVEARSEWEADGERSVKRFGDYDPFGRPGAVTLPDGQKITLTYQGDSRRTITVPVATSVGTTGDPLLSNASTTETSDRFGRLIQVREPNGTLTTYGYNALSNLTEVRVNAGKTPQQTRFFNYDHRGLLRSETHPEIGASVVYSSYDPLGNPGQVDRGGWSLRYRYDAAGRLVKILTPGCKDPAGQPILCPWKEWTYATTNSEGAGARSKGRLKRATRHNYVLAPGATDEPGLSDEIHVPVHEDYTWSGLGGRLSQVVTTVGVGKPQDNTRPVFTYQRSYDALGNVTSRSYPQCSNLYCVAKNQPRSVSSTYTNGLLTAVPGFASAITYHPNGTFAQVTHANGVLDIQEKDPDDMARPARLRTSGASDDFDSGVYAFDGAGNVTTMGQSRMVYDLLSRVTEAETPLAADGCTEDLDLQFLDISSPVTFEACGEIFAAPRVTVRKSGALTLRAGERIVLRDDFRVESGGRLVAELDPSIEPPEGGASEATWKGEYDLFGNLTKVTTQKPGEVEKSRTMGVNAANNRLTVAAYDASGNVSAWFNRTFRYGPFDMLRETGTHIFVYGPGDERIWTIDWTAGTSDVNWVEHYTLRDLDGAPLRRFQIKGGNRADDNWTLEADYIWRDGALLATVLENGVRHFHLDHLGTPRIVTDATRNTRAHHSYFPFGEEATDPDDAAIPLQYTGHERDDLDPALGATNRDLDYMHARYFSAHLGRFQSVDPIGGAPPWPQSWNRYSYVLGNPMKYTDPYGLQELNTFEDDPLASFDDAITVTSPNLSLYFSVLGLLSGPNTTSPWRVGWEWLTGTGERNRFFFDGDTFTEMLKQHETIQNTVQAACAGSAEGPIDNDLGGIQGVPKYLRDYSTLATGGLTGNLAATYLGSYSGEYKLYGGTVHMTVTNTSAAASAFRPPVLGYTDWWLTNVDPRLNQLFSSGPMSATTQTFVMNVACP